jgi:hypothetical protein
LGKRLHKYFLCGFLNQTALAKETAGDVENARAVTPHDLSKGGLVPFAGQTC